MPEFSKGLLLILVLCAGISDVRVRRIPNWLTAPAFVAGTAFSALTVRNGLWLSLAGAACALAVYFPLYLLRGMGAGDVKLMAAVGSICGPSNWLSVFIATALIAGVCALIAVAFYKRFAETAHNLASILGALARGKSPAGEHPGLHIGNTGALRMPHGAFIASGSMLFLLVKNL